MEAVVILIYAIYKAVGCIVKGLLNFGEENIYYEKDLWKNGSNDQYFNN